MKMFLKLPIVAFCLLTLFSQGIAQSNDSIKRIPPAMWTRSHNIDVKHIAIDLRFDWQKRQAIGSAAITLSLFNPSDVVKLDAGMLTINSIKLPDGTTLKHSYDGSDKNDALVISLNRVYKTGEELTIKIDYRTNYINETDPNNIWGSNGKGLRFLRTSTTEPKRKREIWSMGEPESNRYWFPGYDAPNDLRTTEFTATVDKDLVAISNGKLVDTKSNPDGTKTYHWKTETPHSNYRTAFAVGPYVDVEKNFEGIPLHNYGYTGESEAVDASILRLTDIVKFFSDFTGAKYPYPSYSQVFVQESPWGVAYNNMSIHTENFIDDFGTHADFFYFWDRLEAESLAHQWFGNYLSINDWSDAWLSRGFAHYFNGMYNEYKNGHQEFLLWQHQGDKNGYMGDWNSGNRHPIVTKNYSNATDFVSDNYSFLRGAMVLHMLRKHVGESNWQKIIKHYVKTNANKLVTTEDFRKAVEESTGESMEWFFDQWLYKMGHPVFEVTKDYDANKKMLTVKMKQAQKTDLSSQYPQVEFFAGKMEIEIDNRIEQVWVEPKLENVFTFSVQQEPKLVNPDFEGTWIKELKYKKSFDELLYQLQNDNDVLGKRGAMNELVAMAKNEKTSYDEKSKIYEALRNTIASKTYWRLRYAAMLQLQGLLAPAGKPAMIDEATVSTLLSVIKNEGSWNRAAAITFLGMTREAKHADLYLSYFNDPSDRVINSAANALGMSKSPKAFNALVKLKDKPSWKNQSLISTLNGLKELGDPRGYDIAIKALADSKAPHWTLATSIWDHRLAAGETLVALGKGSKGYPIILAQFKKAMQENDINDIFYNVQQATTLADPRGKEIFEMLKARFKDDQNAMVAVSQFESQFNDATKK